MGFRNAVWRIVTAIQEKIEDGTIGLEALKDLILAIPTTPELEATAANRVLALLTAIDATELEADAAARAVAILLDIAAIPITPELEADAETRYDALIALLEHATYGLEAIDTDLTTIAGYVDEEKNKELETEWSTDPVVDNVTSAALSTLTEHAIAAATFVYPSGATEVRVILLAMIAAQAQADAIHHIGLKVQREINDGGWGDLKDFTANPPLGLSGEGGMASWSMPIDIAALVATGDKLEFRFQVDSDNAGSVNYTTSFMVLLVYKMG